MDTHKNNLVEVLREILTKKEQYGALDIGKGKNVVLDYSSPIIGKPFLIEHLVTTVMGYSIKKLHEFAGYHCIGVNHLGDWGTQFGDLIFAYRKWGKKREVERNGINEIVSLNARFQEEVKKDSDYKKQAHTEFTKLEHGDPENMALWEWFIDISLKEYNKIYQSLGINFDSYNGESFYTDKIPAVVEELKRKNLLKFTEHTALVDLEPYKMPPCVILEEENAISYATREIAIALYRKEAYQFEKCIYVTPAAQSFAFTQWCNVIELMGYDWANQLVSVPYQTMDCTEKNILVKNLIMEPAFPIVQATCAQINALLEQVEILPEIVPVEETNLLPLLALYPEKVKAALQNYAPAVILQYALDVCSTFDQFYSNFPIVSEDSKNTRILLTAATNIVLKSAFSLLCFKKTEKI